MLVGELVTIYKKSDYSKINEQTKAIAVLYVSPSPLRSGRIPLTTKVVMLFGESYREEALELVLSHPDTAVFTTCKDWGEKFHHFKDDESLCNLADRFYDQVTNAPKKPDQAIIKESTRSFSDEIKQLLDESIKNTVSDNVASLLEKVKQDHLERKLLLGRRYQLDLDTPSLDDQDWKIMREAFVKELKTDDVVIDEGKFFFVIKKH